MSLVCRLHIQSEQHWKWPRKNQEQLISIFTKMVWRPRKSMMIWSKHLVRILPALLPWRSGLLILSRQGQHWWWHMDRAPNISYHRCPGGRNSSYDDEWYACGCKTHRDSGYQCRVGSYCLDRNLGNGQAVCQMGTPDAKPDQKLHRLEIWLVFSLIQSIFLRGLWPRIGHGCIILTLNHKTKASSGSMPILPHSRNSKVCHLSAKWRLLCSGEGVLMTNYLQ